MEEDSFEVCVSNTTVNNDMIKVFLGVVLAGCKLDVNRFVSNKDVVVVVDYVDDDGVVVLSVQENAI